MKKQHYAYLMNNKRIRQKSLIKELKAGEESGMISDFDRGEGLAKLHAEHLLHNEIDKQKRESIMGRYVSDSPVIQPL